MTTTRSTRNKRGLRTGQGVAVNNNGRGVSSNEQGRGQVEEDPCRNVLQCTDLMTRIALFLTCSDLLKFINVANMKTMNSIISWDMIMQVGFFNGTFYTRRTIEALYDCMCSHSIYLPSKRRVLRLLSGLRCEFCNRRKAQSCRPCWGVFTCWTCLRNLTGRICTFVPEMRRHPTELGEIINHPRIAAKFIATVHDKKHPRRTTVFEYCIWDAPVACVSEQFGPIFTRVDLASMMRLPLDGDIDKYIANELHAQATNLYAPFIDSVKRLRATVHRRANQRKKEKRQAMKQTRLRKIANVNEMIDKIMKHVANDAVGPDPEPILPFFRQDARSDNPWYKRYYPSKSHRINHMQCTVFHCRWLNNQLRPYILAPSKLRSELQFCKLATFLNKDCHRSHYAFDMGPMEIENWFRWERRLDGGLTNDQA